MPSTADGSRRGLGRRRVDPLPEVEPFDLDSTEAAPHIVVEPGGGRRRSTFVLLGLGAAVVLAGLALTTTEDHPSPPPTTDPTTSTTARTAESTTSLVGSAPGPVLGTPIGATVLLGSADAGWRVLDLDTGSLRDAPSLAGLAARQMVAVGGGVIVLDGVRLELVSPPERPARRVVVLGAPGAEALVGGVVASGNPTRVWAIYVSRGGSQGVLIDPDGRAMSVSFDVPGVARGGTARGVVSTAGGRIYLAEPTGTSLLGDGEVLDATADRVATRSCNERAVCRVHVIDLAAGTTQVGPVLPSGTSGVARLSSSGWLATIPSSVGPALRTVPGVGLSVTLTVTDPTGHNQTIDLADLRSEPVWLPHDLGLLAITGAGVLWIHEVDGTLSTERIGTLRAGQDDSIVVIQ